MFSESYSCSKAIRKKWNSTHLIHSPKKTLKLWIINENDSRDFSTTFTDPAVAITLTFKNIFCPSEGANLVQHKIAREYEYSFYILSPQMFSEITLVTKLTERNEIRPISKVLFHSSKITLKWWIINENNSRGFQHNIRRHRRCN